MPKVTVTDQDGTAHDLSPNPGEALMEPLREAGFVDGTCGGAASCGTCHIYVHEDWLEKCGERTEDEGYMLEGLEELVEVKNTSRLACQVTLADSHDGLVIEIAPQI
jgi:2Fe-2S ferredoxin